MKYNVSDYNRAKNLLDTLEKDVLVMKRNYVFILHTTEGIASCIVFDGKQKFVSFASQTSSGGSVGMDKDINDKNDIDVYQLFSEINPDTFISLRAFDFETYDDIIEFHKDPIINSKGASEFFEKYKAVFESSFVK